jgi:hypothetical protein
MQIQTQSSFTNIFHFLLLCYYSSTYSFQSYNAVYRVQISVLWTKPSKKVNNNIDKNRIL